MISNKNAQKEYYLTDLVQLMYEYPMGFTRVTTVLMEDNRPLRGINTPEELAALE